MKYIELHLYLHPNSIFIITIFLFSINLISFLVLIEIYMI